MGIQAKLGSAVLVAATSVSLVACGSTSHTSASRPTTTGSTVPPTSVVASGHFTLDLEDSVQGGGSTACPQGTGPTAECFTLDEQGRSPRLGAVTVDPVIDVEFPPGQQQCGAARQFTEELTIGGGRLAVSVTGPYLCLGVESTTQRSFVVTSGTGPLAGAAGSGTIAFTTGANGATELWTGTLTGVPAA